MPRPAQHPPPEASAEAAPEAAAEASPEAAVRRGDPGASPHSGTPRHRLDWRVRFGLLALVWGLSFLFVKISDEAYAPLQVSSGRVAFGAAALLAVLVVRRQPLPGAGLLWLHLAVAGLLLNAVPFTLFAYSEERISSALAGICNATTPLFTLLVAVSALPGERPHRNQVAGMALGFAGVLVVFGIWNGADVGDPAGAGMALGAALSMGVGWVYVRRFLTGRGHSALSLAAAQLTAGAVELALVTPFLTSAPTTFPAAQTLALLILGALGTGAAFLMQYGLVRDVGVTVASMVTYLVPVISTLAGVVVLHEELNWHQPIGAVVILAGAALSQRTQRTERTAATSASVPRPAPVATEAPEERCTR
ncbi:Permease of the drug/metabolite transporter (DMT) superfamily [Streptomyces sp. 2112.3]|nr:Permease of the drug/metabolite transporter (DMT) superfamily [Streptomyces sp. 2112.3]